MNETILNANGTITVTGDSGSVAGILADAVKANITPAEYDADGVETAEAIIPDAATLMVEVTTDELKVHEWRLPKVRVERLDSLRGVRNAKLDLIDTEIDKAAKNQPGYSRTVANSEVEKQALRDLPPTAESHLATLNNTDDISAYTPDELK